MFGAWYRMIIYSAGKIKTYENLKALSLMVGETEEFAEDLWKYMVFDDQLIDEFNYFVANHCIKGEARCGEYTLLDIYFNQMCKYNLYNDLGKNSGECNKDRLVLHAFKKLVMMRQDPNYASNFDKEEDTGMDIL